MHKNFVLAVLYRKMHKRNFYTLYTSPNFTFYLKTDDFTREFKYFTLKLYKQLVHALKILNITKFKLKFCIITN